MPFYSALDIQLILELSGIRLNSSSEFTKDTSELFDIYARLLTGPLHFLKDTAEYVLKKGPQSCHRRVAFFLNSNQALVAEYNKLNTEQVALLVKAIHTEQLITVDALMTQCLTPLQSLYDHVALYL